MATSTVSFRAYLPWWFRVYLVAVKTFAHLFNLEVDADVISTQARKAVKIKIINR